ncbi:hypothetical protein AB1N83_000660 [Pleurotus pulmonarius]
MKLLDCLQNLPWALIHSLLLMGRLRFSVAAAVRTTGDSTIKSGTLFYQFSEDPVQLSPKTHGEPLLIDARRVVKISR